MLVSDPSLPTATLRKVEREEEEGGALAQTAEAWSDGVTLAPYVSAPAAWHPATDTSARARAGALAATSAAAGSGEGRRAIAVAGPSGVRLEVPPLTVLCMEALIAVLPQAEAPRVPGLDMSADGIVAAAASVLVAPHPPSAAATSAATDSTGDDSGDTDSEGSALAALAPEVRARFAAAVCRSRGMDNHAFTLFTAYASEEVTVPDCAGVDERTMGACLATTRGLTRLALGHAGRGFTSATARALAGSHALAGLTSFSLGGAYVLEDDALGALLATMPSLRHLALSGCPTLTGAFLAAPRPLAAPSSSSSAAPPLALASLHSLDLDALPLITDAALLGTLPPPIAAAPPRPTPAATSSGAKRGTPHGARVKDSGGGGKRARRAAVAADSDEDAAMQVAIAASLEVGGDPAPDGDTSPLEVWEAPPLARSVSAPAALNGSHAPPPVPSPPPSGGLLALRSLQSLRLAHLPAVTDAPLTALATACTTRPRPNFTALAFNRLPLVTDAGVVPLLRAVGASLTALEFTAMPTLTPAALHAVRRLCRVCRRSQACVPPPPPPAYTPPPLRSSLTRPRWRRRG